VYCGVLGLAQILPTAAAAAAAAAAHSKGLQLMLRIHGFSWSLLQRSQITNIRNLLEHEPHVPPHVLLLTLLLLPSLHCTAAAAALHVAGGFGYRQPEATTTPAAQQSSKDQPAVEAMSLYINPPNTPTPGNPAIDALYEADHPSHESRMQGEDDSC
jgi:hypothetical protein